MILPLKNKNRTMDLLNKTCAKNVPKIGSESEVAYLKFFLNSWTWYASELDIQTGEAFGRVFSSMCPEGEYGYFSLVELSEVTGPYGNAVERDLHFSPTKLKDCK